MTAPLITIRPVDEVNRRRLCRCAQPVTHQGLIGGHVETEGCIWCVRAWERATQPTLAAGAA